MSFVSAATQPATSAPYRSARSSKSVVVSSIVSWRRAAVSTFGSSIPNQWKLKPAGVHLELGDLPVNVQLHPTGQYAAVLHCGMKEHEVVVVSLGARKGIASRTPVDQAFYGLAFSPDGRQVYASGGEFD